MLKNSKRGFAHLLLLIILIIGIGLGLYLVKHPTVFKPHASEGTTPTLAFVFTGESNAGGLGWNGYATADELAPTSSVKILNNNTYAFEDLDIGTNNLIDHYNLSDNFGTSAHGFELQLANSVKAHAFPNNPQVYLVKTGQGGSLLSQWNVGGVYWTKFLNRVNSAKILLSGQTVQWVVWYSLGINDHITGTIVSTFKADTIAHINKIKGELPGAIIILTQFQAQGVSTYAEYDTALAEIAASLPNVYVVDSTGAALTSDGYHWEYTGLKTVGARMVDITKTALTIGISSPTPIASASLNPSSSPSASPFSSPNPSLSPSPFAAGQYNPADLNHDGHVNIFDYNILVINYEH